MSKYKFSVITVCYNAQDSISETIKSVLTQTNKEFEYIIKDGDSTDDTMRIVGDLVGKNNQVKLIQGKDKGIYDAMNIAVKETSGEYVLFLNAGDTFYRNTTLEQLSQEMCLPDIGIYYGNIVQVGTEGNEIVKKMRIYSKNSIKKMQYAVGRCLCHQAMLAKKKLFEERLFDLQYQVCADREWQLYHLAKGCKTKYLPITVSEVLVEGYSKLHVSELEAEVKQCVYQYCREYVWMYNTITLLKRNRVIGFWLNKLDSFSKEKKEKYE